VAAEDGWPARFRWFKDEGEISSFTAKCWPDETARILEAQLLERRRVDTIGQQDHQHAAASPWRSGRSDKDG